MIPGGFLLKWDNSLYISEHNEDSIEETLEAASFQEMRQTTEEIRNKLIDVNLEIQTGLARLEDMHSAKQYTYMLSKLKYHARKTGEKIRKTNQKKFNTSKTDKDIPSLHDNKPLKKPDVISEQIMRVKADGNCYFRTISQALHGYEDQRQEIRNIIVAELIANQERYEMYIDEDFTTHIDEMKQSDDRISSWASEAEIFATTHYLNTDIFVVTIINQESVGQQFSSGECNHDNPFISIEHTGNHYNYIKRDFRPCTCTTAENIDQ